MTKAVEKKAETTAKTVEAVKAPAAAAVKPVEAKSVEKTEKKAAPKAAKKETKKAAKTTKKAATKTAKKETKAAPKAAEKKPAAKTAEKKAAAPKAAAAKAPAVKVVLEFQGRQVSADDILSAVMAKAGKAKNVEIYVKPEDGAAYYVADGESGKVEF